MENPPQGEIARRLKAILSGDAAAAAWLYDTFAARLFRRLKARYGYPGGLEAEDLLQDSFLFYFQNDGRVLRQLLNRHPGEEISHPQLEAHLWNLACGIASNRRRSASKRQSVTNLTEEKDSPLPATAENLTVHRDVLQRLEECLRNGRERIFLYYSLRHRDGLTPEEIAGATGWSRKATYKLKQALDEAVTLCAKALRLVADP